MNNEVNPSNCLDNPPSWFDQVKSTFSEIEWGNWKQKATAVGTAATMATTAFYGNSLPEEQVFAVSDGCEVSDELVEESHQLRTHSNEDDKPKGNNQGTPTATDTPTLAGNLNNAEATTNTERALGLFLAEVEYQGASTMPQSGTDIHFYTNQDKIINPEAAEELFAFGSQAEFQDPLAGPVLECHDELMFDQQRYSDVEINFVFIVDEGLQKRGLAISGEHAVILGSTSAVFALSSQYRDIKEVAGQLPERPTIFMTAPSNDEIENIWVHESNHIRGYLADNRVITRLPEMEDEGKTVERAAIDYYGGNWPELLVPAE